MKKDNFIVILAWMNGLGLSLVEKTVYAVVYGFSQDGASAFSGSRKYLADWCGCSSLRTIDSALNKLVERKLIIKKVNIVNNVRVCCYAVDCTGSANFAQGWGQNCPYGSANFAHNHIDNNADNKLSANSDTDNARARAFDFKNSLIELGISEQTAADWMAVRKNAKATNTRTAFVALKNQIEKIVRRHGVTAEQVAAFAVGKDWKGINAEWDAVKTIKNAINSTDNSEDENLPF